MQAEIRPGQSFPLGATVYPDGVNFSVYSKNATGLDLLLFDEASDPKPAHLISLDPVTNRTYHYWHIFLSGLRHVSYMDIESGAPLSRARPTL